MHSPLPREAYTTMSGLEALRAMIAGTLPRPPMAKAMNMTLVEADEGRAVFEGVPTEDYLNPGGTVHGGWAATLLDSALGCAVHTAMRPGEAYTTVEFKVSLVRPILPSTGKVRCEGLLINRGRRLALSEAKLIDGAGKLLAHGTETCLIFAAGERG